MSVYYQDYLLLRVTYHISEIQAVIKNHEFHKPSVLNRLVRRNSNNRLSFIFIVLIFNFKNRFSLLKVHCVRVHSFTQKTA